jgi:hypothetical protein
MDSFRYPLAGEFSMRKDAMAGLRIPSDWGLEVGVQMAILVSVLVALYVILVSMAGGFSGMLQAFPDDRRNALDFSSHGLGDGEDFAFWPMLLGGFFLYVSYYGCDQSQVQRELCARNQDESQQALLLNGLFRFPLVMLYCLVGVGIGVYAGSPLVFCRPCRSVTASRTTTWRCLFSSSISCRPVLSAFP